MTTTATELEIYFNNEQWLIKPATIAIGKAHQKPGFSYDRALKFLTNRCRDAAKAYQHEFGSMADRWQDTFPLEDRKEAAEAILESMLAEFRLGNYWR